MRLKLSRYGLLICLFICLQSCKKDNPIINSTTEFEAYLQDEMEAQHIPALSVLIFKEDAILHEAYLGQSNIQQNLPLGADHLFLLASVSKVITATALLQLYEDGHFGLDDDINNHLPFDVSYPGSATPITFRMLLTHTSGIGDNGTVMDAQYFYNQDPPIALAAFMENYLKVGGSLYDPIENFYDFEPGEDHEYSNMGTALIGVLVENISGQDFNSYCKQHIFTPLAMTHTAWRLDEITQPIATPYDYFGGQNQAIQHYTNTDYPNGGLRSTARDLHRFLRVFTLGGLSNNYQLLEESTLNLMKTPQIPDIDPEVGLHLFLMNAQLGLWGHDGGEQGVATVMAFHPDTHVGAIILSNQGEAYLDDILQEAYEFGLKL